MALVSGASFAVRLVFCAAPKSSFSRWINEVLYKSDSAHAHDMMREDRNVFDEVCFVKETSVPSC